MRPGEIIVDSFAGGGGASLGISWALGRAPDIAINHDKEAIALHAANHPDSTHYAEDVWKVDPVEACAGRPVGLMWLSPDCKHFSKAKGGKPVSKKVRGLAWLAVRWAKAVKPRVIVLENVEEFQGWGPVLVETGKPCPARKGKTFRAFIARLRRLGYEVEWRELRACDYGAPTIRRRLFIVMRCDGQPITWPKPTHGKGRLPFRTAAECIDWTIPCPSIFERKRALAENTLKRIARGLRRFVIESPRPFIVNMAHGGKEESLGAPLSTIATERGGCRALVAPVLVPRYGERAGQEPRARSVEDPMPTIVPTGNGASLVSAVLAGVGGRAGQSPERPLDRPYHTLTAKPDTVLVSAFLAKHYGERKPGEVQGASLFDPAPTVTTVDHSAIVAAHLEVMHGTGRGWSVTDPMPTILGGGSHLAAVKAFLVAYYGNEKDGADLFDPMRTITARDRFGLVTVEGQDYAIADIGMRMLAMRELYRAQGFPDSYRIDVEHNGKPLTKEAQGRMVGNSVVPHLARDIIAANLGQTATAVAA
jgi:DNA (cytosine-5)-methyltransferase 1